MNKTLDFTAPSLPSLASVEKWSIAFAFVFGTFFSSLRNEKTKQLILTCGKKALTPIFDSIFYFSIKLPFHKFPLCQMPSHPRTPYTRPTPSARKIFDWKFNLGKLIYAQIPFLWRWCFSTLVDGATVDCSTLLKWVSEVKRGGDRRRVRQRQRI